MTGESNTRSESRGTPSESIRAILDSREISDSLDEIAEAADFGSFTSNTRTDTHEIARAALSLFFSCESSEAVEDALRNGHAGGAVRRMVVDGMDHPLLGEIARKISDAILRHHDLRPEISNQLVRAAINDALDSRLEALDRSVPLDLLGNEEIIVCYIPDLSFERNLFRLSTTFSGQTSDSTSVCPDNAFARFLGLLNVSPAEYVDIVRRLRGVDLRAGTSAWDEMHFTADQRRGHLIDERRIIEGIDGCPYGFNPMIAFRTNARTLIERDWTKPMTITGGVVGLHDFTNGSGNPQRFEGSITIDACPTDFVVGEGRRNDFFEAYGFAPATFDSRVSDDNETSLSPAFSGA